MRYMRQEEKARGYQYVSTPILAQEQLYQRSGHADYYLDNMYSTAVDEEGNKFFVAPMNCPHHHMIYEKMVTSYNDLPLRLSEHAGLYRYELSGTLTGLIRVRGPITQNDSHIYVTKEQLRDELKNLMLFFESVYKQFNFKDYWYRVSLPDFSKDKYGGDEEQWRYAASLITEVLEEIGAQYVSEEGEAAFYGPKIDVQTKNVNGKEDSIATMQIDVLVPKRMGLTYVDEHNKHHHPYVIHKSIMGAFERFMGFLLEQTAGHFPFWLAPEQVRILTINDSVLDYVDDVKKVLEGVVLMKPLKYNELRYTVDDRSESLGKKIREASTQKIPVMLIIGDRDKQDRTVSARTVNGEETVDLDELSTWLKGLGK
jgi:threonyl-tRNA synthetase